MTRRRLSALACALALTAAQAALLAQYTVPNTTTTAGDEAATLGGPRWSEESVEAMKANIDAYLAPAILDQRGVAVR
jgi:hypothetical protein